MRVLGLETEYGLVARTRESADAPWRRVPSDEAGTLLFAPLARRHGSTSTFTRGGGRVYLDVGAHPEYATPECTSAHDVGVAERAGDELLLGLAREATDAEAAAGRETEFTLVKNNVDPWGNTYGSHENYQVARATDPDRLAGWLVPFLVARQLIAGAGRWRRGRFTISQRCNALADVVSSATTRARPLINTRDEPHADPERWRRLHVISGDSNLVETSAWLKWATTELVLRLAESGRTPPFALADPLDALRRWGADPDAAVPSVAGDLVTCHDLHAAWLEAASEEATDADGVRALAGWRSALTDGVEGRGPWVPEWRRKRDVLFAWRDRHGAASDDRRLDDLDVRWHLLGPGGLARLVEARGGFARETSDAQVAAAAGRPPSATRARIRARLVETARAHDRDYAVDWATFAVRDLPGRDPRRPAEVVLRLDDPSAAADPDADALIERMRSEPRIRALGGFTPPPG